MYNTAYVEIQRMYFKEKLETKMTGTKHNSLHCSIAKQASLALPVWSMSNGTNYDRTPEIFPGVQETVV